MNKNITRTQIVILITSLILSLGIVRWKTQSNVPPCINTPACDLGGAVQGTLRSVKEGYPLTYREKLIFEPTVGADYASASTETSGLSLLNVLINTLFWYALLALVIRHLAALKNDPKKKSAKKRSKKR